MYLRVYLKFYYNEQIQNKVYVSKYVEHYNLNTTADVIMKEKTGSGSIDIIFGEVFLPDLFNCSQVLVNFNFETAWQSNY